MMRFWAGSGVFMMIPGAESTFLHSKLMMSWTEPGGLSGSFFFKGGLGSVAFAGIPKW